MIEKHRLHNLHAIRGWAALLVVISHAKNHFWTGGSEYINKYPFDTWEWYQYILMGIDMSTSFAEVYVITFFVLSGFFITRSIKVKNYSIPFFYGDRIIRIYIPYIGALLIAFLMFYVSCIVHPELFKMSEIDRAYNNMLIEGFSDFNIDSFMSALLFLPGESGNFFGINYPSWSLYFEALFYITIPFIILYVKKYMFFLIASVLFIISFFYGGNWLTIKAFIFSYSIYFAMGVLLYELTNDKNSRYIIVKMVRRYTNTFFLVSVIIMLAAIPLGHLGYRKYGFFLGMIATALLILLVLYGKNTKSFFFFKRLLINKISKFLGMISFSLYLVHVPVMTLYYAILTKYTGEIVFYDRIYWIAVLCVIPVGYISYLIFEKNSLVLLERYKKKYANTKKA